jgi:hypothetical protein
MELLERNIPEPERDFLETSDPQSLSLLKDLHEVAGFEQRGVRSGIEPRITTA